MMHADERGFSLVEVVVAMSISMVVVLGGMAALQVSARLAHEGVMKTRAVSLAQGRLEAKRSVRWEAMLQDDLDHDGRPDVGLAARLRAARADRHRHRGGVAREPRLDLRNGAFRVPLHGQRKLHLDLVVPRLPHELPGLLRLRVEGGATPHRGRLPGASAAT